MNIAEFAKQMSDLTERKIPYFFVVDFEMEQPFICPIEQTLENNILFDFNGMKNTVIQRITKTPELISFPISWKKYLTKINSVIDHQKKGDSYLLNLTFPTPISTNFTLEEIFYASNASFKLFYKNKFVVFSPERFVQIRNNKIYTFPMKGTIDATLSNAQELLINSYKELSEHNTIVDLMRNDLSIIAENIQIERFRYIDKIKTFNGEILQTSSSVNGHLPTNWRTNFGEQFLKLLPAGSISGAPKKKTVEIIQTIEEQPRGFYTGVFGIFDGEIFDSAVNIRFIEKKDNDLYYRSGGGITAKSIPKDEYDELIKKIYLPI